MTNTPLISIITPSFNQASFIGEALESVLLQSHDNWEHLVVDGVSTDGTVDLLRHRTANSSQKNMFWISERDNGQSEALNKGFRQAKGEIIGWLNSDDRYRANCFEHVVQGFRDNPEADIIYGDYLLVDESGKVLKIRREIEFNAFILLYHRILYIPTTATFFRRRIFDEGSWLDEKLQYAMDLEFFIRLSARGYRFKHIPHLLADFRMQPGSKTCRAPELQRMEHRQVVLAAAPIFRRLRYPSVRRLVLMCFRAVAGFRRYSEKMLRGYYWSPNSGSLIEM
ncbi:MAG: glycosyltransferase [Edaphobacter sp.]|nr:glycosyltransferase [Edaphobacter sp.]